MWRMTENETLKQAGFGLIGLSSMGSKSNNRQVGFIKLKSFHTGKETVNRMKRQSTEWEKIFANHLISG
jgi:hypothetical protein